MHTGGVFDHKRIDGEVQCQWSTTFDVMEASAEAKTKKLASYGRSTEATLISSSPHPAIRGKSPNTATLADHSGPMCLSHYIRWNGASVNPDFHPSAISFLGHIGPWYASWSLRNSQWLNGKVPQIQHHNRTLLLTVQRLKHDKESRLLLSYELRRAADIIPCLKLKMMRMQSHGVEKYTFQWRRRYCFAWTLT
jgi:hypothetical protein